MSALFFCFVSLLHYIDLKRALGGDGAAVVKNAGVNDVDGAAAFSQLERETIAERILDNMHELSKTGRWLGGTTPTGYAPRSGAFCPCPGA